MGRSSILFNSVSATTIVLSRMLSNYIDTSSISDLDFGLTRPSLLILIFLCYQCCDQCNYNQGVFRIKLKRTNKNSMWAIIIMVLAIINIFSCPYGFIVREIVASPESQRNYLDLYVPF